MSKASHLANLYRESVQLLTQNRTEWMGLLTGIAKFYRLSFDKNVLIHLQYPDAGLLATKAAWEKQTGRYLKAGSKGIGVVEMSDPVATLAYYFDFVDTRGSHATLLKAMGYVWELEQQYQPEILGYYHQRFGADGDSIENCLYQLTAARADDLLREYLEMVRIRNKESVLYGFPDEVVKQELERVITDSAAYIVFAKCGIETDIFDQTRAFENISHFGNLEVFMQIGHYATEVAKPVLMDIHRQIEKIKEERGKKYEQRTISGTGLSPGSGRDVISQSQDISQQGIRPADQPPVRKHVEELSSREVPPAVDRTDHDRIDQRDDQQSGRGSGTAEGIIGQEAIGKTADAGDGKYSDTYRPYGDIDQPGGGNNTSRSSLPASLDDGRDSGNNDSLENDNGNNDSKEMIVEIMIVKKKI